MPDTRFAGTITQAAALCAMAAVTVSTNASIVNGSFESPGTGYVLLTAGATVGGWTCVGDSVEYVHATPAVALPGLEVSAFEGEYWIDLGGVGGSSGIYQDVAGLSAGQWYRVSFAQAGNVWGDDVEFTLQVSWNGTQVGSFSSVHGGGDGAAMNWQQRSVDVLATGGVNRLQFFSPIVTSARGAAIDAVSISLVPAPGAAALLGAAGLGSRRRRARSG
jgi:hypothetical protein